MIRQGLLLGTLLMVAFIVTSLVAANKTGNLAKTEAMARMREAGQVQGTRFAKHLNRPLHTARSLALLLGEAAQNQTDRPIQWQDYDSLFVRTIKEKPDYFGAWAVFGPNQFGNSPNTPLDRGYVPFALRENDEISFRHDDYQFDKKQDYYRLPKERKQECLIEPYVDTVAGDALMASLAVPVFSGDHVIGVTGVDVKLAALSGQIAEVRPYEAGRAILLSSHGLIVAHPDHKKAGTLMTDHEFDERHLEKVKKGEAFDEIRVDPLTGVSSCYTFTPVSIGDTGSAWTMVMVVPTEVILRKAHSITFWISLITALAIGVTLTVLALFLRSVVRPLHESHNTVNCLLDSMIAGVVMHDRKGNVLSYNKRFPELLGISAGEVSTALMPGLLNQYGLTPSYPAASPDNGTNDVIPMETGHVQNSEGEIFPVELDVRRVKLHGEPCYLTVIRDISERVKMEKTRKETLSRIRRQESAILELALNTPQGRDLMTTYRTTTETAAQTLGVSRVSIWTGDRGLSKVTCMDLYDSAGGTHSSGQEIQTSDFPDYFEALAKELCINAHDAKKDPRTMAFNDMILEPLGITSMLDSVIRVSGTIEGIICFEHTGPARTWTEDECSFASQVADHLAKSIVHARALQEEQNHLEFEIQFQEMQKLESLGIMAGGIAHDFNNLLLTIMGNLEMGLDYLSSDHPSRAGLEESRQAALMAADLCGQMLAYSGKNHFTLEPIALAEMTQDMVAVFESSISRRATLQLETEENLPLILGDSSQMRQILLNLVINAADAMTNHSGTIHIRLKTRECGEAFFTDTILKDPLPSGTYVELQVRDNGSGMDETTLRKIFDPFFTTKFTGRGLGLASVLGMVRGHKGTIAVDSALGKGTTFTILLPVAPEKLPANDIPVSPRKNVSTSRLLPEASPATVLLIDDDASVRLTISRQLDKLGCEVITAAGGHEALEILQNPAFLRETSVDIVLLDLTMPQMDGAETFERIHLIHPHLPVLLCSGYSNQELRARFEGKPVAGYLCKPFEIGALHSAIQDTLQKRQPCRKARNLTEACILPA